MKKATGGGLPAHIFHAFMTDAEQNLPPRPLPGSQFMALAQAQTQAVQTATATTPEQQKQEQPQQTDQNNAPAKPDALDRILNGLFGGT